MKTLFLISILSLCSCSDSNLELISTEVVKGKVSEVKVGWNSLRGPGEMSKIYIQNPTYTKCVEIPVGEEQKYKVGDTAILVIQKYKENIK